MPKKFHNIYVKEIDKTRKNDKEEGKLQVTVFKMRVGILFKNWQGHYKKIIFKATKPHEYN